MSSTFPDLRRPQYPSSPEVLLSALAWSTVPRAHDPDEEKSVGLIYGRKKSTGKRAVNIAETKPQGEALEAFCAALLEAGAHDLDGQMPLKIGQAIANSLDGTPPSKGVGLASSSIGLAGALLQDPIGGLGVQNPPNFAQLINTIYRLGSSDAASSASEAWFGAAKYHAEGGRLHNLEVALVNSALAKYLQDSSEWPPSQPRISTLARASDAPIWWQGEVIEPNIQTPFSWFRTSWDRLCSCEWYEKLPSRRWASWAICLLRHALAFTFLWEANFYCEIAKGAVDKKTESKAVARRALVPVRPLIPYRTGTISQMDVQPTFKRMLEIGLGCMNALKALGEEVELESESLPAIIEKLRESQTDEHKSRLINALSGSGEIGGMSNLLETVRYSLLARESEVQADNYSLLRNVSRRFYHVAPGPEWIVVMSAMSAADGPNSTVRLGDLIQSLKGLGFQPRIDFLLAELERAGLCASAPDGDEGIEINLGFGGG